MIDANLAFGILMSGVFIGVVGTMYLFKPDRREEPTNLFNEILRRKHTFLWDMMFNTLYHDHPELWTWIKEKQKEYDAIGTIR